MEVRPTNTSSRPAASHPQRRASFLRSLFVIAVGVALLSLALAVPISMAARANARSEAADISSRPSVDDSAGNQAAGALPDAMSAPRPDLPRSRSALLAGVVNGGFETGDLTNWTVGGSAAKVEVLQSSNFSTSAGPAPAPTEGNYFALLCSGPGVVNATSQGNIDGDGLATNDYDTSIMTTTLSLTAADVPATLSFDWSFLTDEGRNALDAFDDFFQVTLNGVRILDGSRPIGGVSLFPDVTGMDNVAYTVTGATNNCFFGDGRNSFQTFRTIISTPGSYTLVFLVADQGGADIDSGLLIDNVQLTPEIDLELLKTATPDPAVPGEPLTYEITVNNNGTGRATDVVVTDTLPSEVQYIVDTAGCDTTNLPVLACALGDMVGGTSKSFEIKVDVNSNAMATGALTITNTAVVDSLTPDRNLENNTVSLVTLLQDSADLRVVKMSKPDTSVRAGDLFTYTIFVDNLGPSHARNVVLTDTILSSGAFTLVSVDDDPNRTDSCTTSAISGGTLVTCSLNQSLEPQGDPPGNGRWTIQMTVRANQAQDVNNEVNVFSLDPDGAAGPQTATPDPDTSNNRATDFISVTATADLGMTKIGQDAGSNPDGNSLTVLAGESVTWVITVTNGGPSTAENVAVVDTLPKGLVQESVTAVAVTPPVGGGQCNVGTPGDPNEPLICQVGNLAPGDTAIITITADIDPSYVATQPNTGFADFLPNDAHLTSDTFDPDTDDNIVFDALVRVLAQADLGVQKIDRPDFVIAGQQLEYTLTISNAGPSTAEDVTLLDELPSALTSLQVNVVNEPAATCSFRTTPANIIDCGFGNILPGKTITLVITSLVSASAPAGTITNTATVSSLTPDPNVPEVGDPTPNQVQETTQVETQADVEISKVGEPVKVPAGEQVKYTLWVENNGPSDAQDVTVFDLLPDEVDYEIDTNSPMCTRPETLVGLRAPLSDTLGNPTVAAGLATFVLITDTNKVQFAVEVTDIDNITGTILTNGTLTAQLYSGPPPVFDPPNALVGSIISPTLVAALLANPTSFQVIVQTSDFPSGEIQGQVEEAVTTMTQEPNTPLRCEIGTLAAGASHHFDIWALVDPATPAGTVITNVSIVTSTTTLGDPVPGNNVGSFRNFVEGEADLHIRKFGKPDGEVRANEILTYTVVVDNLGPSAAEGVAIKDVLQTAATFDLVDISSDRETFCAGIPGPTPGVTVTATAWPPGAAPPPPGVDPQTGVQNISERLELDCTLTGGLEVLAADGPPNSGRWLLTVRVRGLDHAQNFNNVASVLSEQPDPNLDNNDAFVLHDIIDVADMEIDKSAVGEVQVDGQPGGVVSLVPDRVTAGRTLVYTLTVTNNGPSTAENVVIQDRLPPGVVVTGFDAGSGDCDTGTPGEPLDKLTCGLGTMAPLASTTVQVTLRVDPSLPGGTILENDALVFSDLFDDNNANDRATNLTTVDAWADLVVTKTDNPDPVVAGELLEYTVTVTNTGPSDAIDVVVVDVLPQAVTFERIRDPFATGVSCSLNPIDEHTLTCALGDMPFGDVKTFTILVRVNPAAPATLDNQVSVSSDTLDPNTGDNTFNEQTGVNRAQQLFVVKSDFPDPVIAGTELQYTVSFGNNGPSQAANSVVTDTLPLGVIFDRCESLDPNDRVTCSVIAGDGNITQQIVRVDEILEGNTVVYTNTGIINVGDSFTFRLIADVESGYVLNGRGDTTITDPDSVCDPLFQATGYPHFAHNRADITADLLDQGQPVGSAADRDDECTRVNAEADLEITKADGAGFQVGDPVSPGGTITYTITIANHGPSDAAEVTLVDLLPPDGIALDPTLVTVVISGTRGITEEIRDDGRITVLAGDDEDNNMVKQFGRINAGGDPVTVQIGVIVTQDAECGGTITNTASVETRRNDAVWPPLAGAAFAPTPTEDPDLTNNTDDEDTSIVCPEIQVDKTVSLDGTCPGTNNVAIGFLGQPVTYCYELTNTGATYLDTIIVTDTVVTRSGPVVIFEETFHANPDVDPNLPFPPGTSFIVSTTVSSDIMVDCNDRPDTAVVTAQAVNRGRTPFFSVPVALATDMAVVETPCKGVDWRLQLPALNTDECDTWIQVQNVGNVDTKALLVLWGEPGACPPQAYGPLKVECTGLLRPGSAWSFSNRLLPPGARSGIMYSMNATDKIVNRQGNLQTFADVACTELFTAIRQDYDQWAQFDEAYRTRGIYLGPIGNQGQQTMMDFGAHQGEPLAVTVNRTCPDPVDPNLESSAAYVGISTDREGIRDPRAGQYAYYAPLVWADYFGMNSIIHVQNSGVECTSVELWFQRQGDCIRPVVWNILSIAPGESYPFDPNEVVGPNWQGSIWLRASQPMGVVVDTLGANHFGAYHGVPADIFEGFGDRDFTLGTQVNYAPLIYREHQGWESSIQVQNLSSTHNAKVKVYFLDNSGDVIKTVVDWICPRGSQTFFLPVIAGLPGNWIGSARIESQDWLSPGDPAISSPRILSVVLLEKYTDPAKAARQEAVVYNALQEMGSFDWQVGPGQTTGFSGSDVLSVPLVAKGAFGVTTELAIQNLNPNPGFTDFVIFVYDQNGILDYVCEKLNEKQVEYIDLNEWGVIRPGFLGSVVISANFNNQKGGAALGAVAVERVGRSQSQPDLPGDESKAFEAFPLFNRFKPEEPVQCPGQP